MFNLIKTSIALSCVLSGHSAFAQPVNDSDVIADEIVVTAKGQQSLSDTLHTAHVFTLADIEASQARDIPTLLNQLVGVSVSESGGRGSTTSVFVRGVSNSQIIVLIDGVRVGSATLGTTALNAYPVEAIERIEVLKGPFSGIYGADAVGGVIQLFTKKGGNGRGSVTASIGDDSLTEFGASISGGDDRNSFHLAAFTEETDGIDRTTLLNDGNGDVDGFEETAISLGARLSFGESTVANVSILATDSTVEFDQTFGSDPGSKTDTKTISAALNVSTELNEKLKWSTTLGSNEDEADTFSNFPSTFTTNRDSLGSELELAFGDNSFLTAGVDYYDEDIESSNDYALDQRDNTGAYAQVQTGAGAFGFVGSLRYDDNSAYGTNTNGSAAVNVTFSDNLRAVASYGSAFVAPSFNYLYFPFFGNPDILPEESDSVELSLVGTNDTLSWRVSAYQTDVTNLFSFDPATFLAANIGEAELKGLELSVNTVLAEWNLSLNADLLSAEDKDTGIELDDRAGKTILIAASRRFGKLDFAVDLKSESDRFDNRGTEVSSHSLVDIRAHYTVNDNLSVLANIENLFDKDYTLNLIGLTDRYNTEGRQAKLTIKYRF